MKVKQLCAVAFLAACGSALGSVTLGFSVETVSGLANAAGVPSNGLYYGVIVDAAGDGFFGNYSDVSYALGQTYILNSSVTSLATDDVLVIAQYQTFDNGAGDGGVYDVGPFDLLTGLTGGAAINTGDAFRLVWISGTSVGTLADASFTIPADGALQDYTAPFVGTDPVRTAGFSYSGTGAQTTGPGFVIGIPEPSAALLGAVGALGLLRRRRN